MSAGQEWSDRFNVNVAVSGASNWVVTIGTDGGQSLQNSWNASVSGTSGTLTARPNGNGNNFGITIMANGNWNLVDGHLPDRLTATDSRHRTYGAAASAAAP